MRSWSVALGPPRTVPEPPRARPAVDRHAIAEGADTFPQALLLSGHLNEGTSGDGAKEGKGV